MICYLKFLIAETPGPDLTRMDLEDKTILGSLAMISENLSYRTLRGVGYEPEARAGCTPTPETLGSLNMLSDKSIEGPNRS